MSNRAQMTFSLVLAAMLLASVFMLGMMAPALGAASDPWGSPPIGAGGVQSMSIPAQDAVAVTPSATVDLSLVSRAIYSHDGGNVACLFPSGNSMVFLFAAGEIKPLRCKRVLVSGTDSTVIGALY